jgi:uncharacterized protein (TIGR00255 family)
MTGLGFGEAFFNGTIIQAEIKSVNNRFLEVSCRLPAFVSQYEGEVRDLVRKQIHRGKLYITITMQGEDNTLLDLRVNAEMARSVQQVLEELREAAGLSDPLKVEHLLKFSEVFEPLRPRETSEKSWKYVRKALKSAIEDLKAMREREGEILTHDIKKRAAFIIKTCSLIEKKAEKNSSIMFNKMIDRIKIIMEDDRIDQNRMYSEIAILSDKVDVTEECVRLRSHTQLFDETLMKANSVGKRLNFLLQEMNREVNTISAKAANADISHLVVEIKEEIEKIREQVQNLE